MDLDETDEWVHSIQNILKFLELWDKDKGWRSSSLLKKDTYSSRKTIWNEFTIEFNQRYFNMESLRAQQIVFLNLKQEGNCDDWSGQEIW